VHDDAAMTQSIRLSSDLFLHLTDTLRMEVARSGTEYWDHRDRAELTTGRLVSVFTYETSWDYQERHPDGDELVLVLEGEVELLLDTGAGDTPVHLDRGSACVIPAGAWHRAAVHAPTTMLFVTPVPARTQHRPLAPTGEFARDSVRRGLGGASAAGDGLRA
jgi:mannose-6-phosphate isomerase-like protein (cupin superfamily)